MPKPPDWRRVGHIQRRVRRAFIASRGEPLTTGELARRCYPRLPGITQSWRYRCIREAAARYAVRIGTAKGKRGRAVLWGPSPELAERVRQLWGLGKPPQMLPMSPV